MSASVLVVEDDLNMQELIVETLEDEGYIAHGASSVADALTLAGRYSFDLVVTDVRMAGQDGVKGLEILKKTTPHLKCIVITGYADRDVMARAVKIQTDDYIMKPFSLDDILLVVDRVLNSGKLSAYYSKLVSKVTSGPGRIFAAAAQALRNKRFKVLEVARDRAFQGLYVAIKSSLIPINSANGVFSKLASHDHDYQTFLESPDRAKGESLLAAYNQLFEFLTALARSKAQMLGEKKIPPAEFRVFFTAIQKGLVTPEQLHLAPALYAMKPGELLGQTELLKLRKTMWG